MVPAEVTPERAYDAVVVGAGPNGLAAAVELARSGKSVALFETRDTVGGGCRSAPLTRKRFVHDVCSSVHALAAASPFMRSVPLHRYGVELVHAPLPLVHALDGNDGVALERSVHRTALSLGVDSDTYRRLFEPLVEHAENLVPVVLGPLRQIPDPRMVGFGLKALRTADSFAQGRFSTSRARALFAGVAAHSMLSLRRSPTAGVGILLMMLAHAVGWPVTKGGSQRLADALAAYLRDLGGEVFTGTEIRHIAELPRAQAYLFDLTPRQFVSIAGDRLPPRYVSRLDRYRYGPGIFKLDLALDGPVPWNARDCAQAVCVHVGGSIEEISASEEAVAGGRHAERPFVILVQPTVADETRAPKGKHTLWAYCHVPSGSTVDMTERIEDQIERFAHHFRDRIIARRTMTAAEFEAYNPNYVGGDINGGLQDLRQLFTRPVARVSPYTTPNKSIYICSSATPPGGGVHGMSGYHAARAALKRAFTASAGRDESGV